MRNRKNGVAVIIVLGLLALLMVLGVAFTVTMRGERAGAANYLAAAASRHLVWAGLAQALDAVNTTMGDDVYPPGDFLVSGRSAWNEQGSSVALLTQQVEPYVPDAILDFIETQVSGGLIRSSWVDAGDGNVAYLVLNLSDMLDANHVGGEPRAGGRSVSELMLSTNILTLTQYANFMTARAGAGGSFINLPAFRRLAPSVPPVAFETFSRYLLDEDRAGAVYIGGNVATLQANRANIEAGLRGLAPPGEDISEIQASRIFALMLDYIKDGLAPTTLAGPNVKPVPLINEVTFSIDDFGFDPGVFFGFQFRPRIETWYPYVNAAAGAFRLSGDYTVEIDQVGSAESTFSQSASFESSINVSGSAPDHPFVVPNITGIDVILNSPVTNNFLVNIQFSNLTVSSGPPVDRVSGVFFFVGTWSEGMDHTAIPWEPLTYQATDPRFNWSLEAFSENAPWQINESPGHLLPRRLGSINVFTDFYMQAREGGENWIRKRPQLYSSMNGALYSPLELGNIPLLPATAMFDANNYWHDIRSLNQGDQPRHLILENFTTNPMLAADTTVPLRGLVNVNSFDERILRTAFAGMPHPYVGGGLAESPANLARLNAVIAVITDHRNNTGPFGSITELLELDWRANATLQNLSDLELEALLAYVIELLGVRQNLFLVLVTATEGERMEGTVLRGRARAMALVWRDPVANDQELHDHFIQYFRWLD